MSFQSLLKSLRGEFNSLTSFFKSFSRKQTISLVTLLFLLYALPLSIIAVGYQTYKASRALETPITPPTPNNNPQITTNGLPKGYLGKRYNATVKAIDYDSKDQLAMTITKLPSGLSQGSCRLSSKRKFLGKRIATLSCKINGKPERTGKFFVNVFVTDNKGGTDQKTLELTIALRRK